MKNNERYFKNKVYFMNWSSPIQVSFKRKAHYKYVYAKFHQLVYMKYTFVMTKAIVIVIWMHGGIFFTHMDYTGRDSHSSLIPKI